ncbi:hypothetical protein [Neisseria weaveri]|uniref:hypothetical protein n=1 Tax=Neisseria weaveri TaxID=28091 RepID=UPI000223076A|nr:hypothetical protein [Neisseria weaveri]EGV36004.1 hypothetical protein l13_10280 [Neisseria weaveri ATCC 51223]EGV38827.1 hypothetical protein l11_02740 [Neisseria weaveri LMG 5135]
MVTLEQMNLVLCVKNSNNASFSRFRHAGKVPEQHKQKFLKAASAFPPQLLKIPNIAPKRFQTVI